jgi:hypothetical protein
MYHNVLNYSLEALTAKVDEDSERRRAALAEATSKNDVTPKTRAGSSAQKLSDQEKAILKALGLSMKDVKALAAGGGSNE